MSHAKIRTGDQISKSQRVSLLELLDRLLDKGVMVKGEVLLSVADIDLVYLNVGLLLSSVKTVEQAARSSSKRDAELLSWQSFPQGEVLEEPRLGAGKVDQTLPFFPQQESQHASDDRETPARTLAAAIDYGLDQLSAPATTIDPKNVEKGLAKLVLTLVDLIRKLMEKQAVRRIDAGQLDAGEIERMGNAFFLLDERMGQLKETFGLQDEDLNLDLGPLGELL
ncbi:MAG TPA: gas vesicle protein K [Ktedonobacteraceae bacterium]|nr:gas vesicle protein K [Ktedonobacteraceae bacterium]